MKAARLVVLVVASPPAASPRCSPDAVAKSRRRRSPSPPPTIDTVDVLVAKSDIQLGQTVSAQDMQWQLWPTPGREPRLHPQDPTSRTRSSSSPARSRARPFVAGEPIREAKLIKANGSGFMAAILPTGMRAVSTEISPETGAGGFILPNDHVDVILSRRDREAEKAGGTESHTSETILTNIRVLAIDQTLGEKDGQKVVIGKTATLELTPRQAETLALSRQLGTLSLALRSLADANDTTLPSDDERTAGKAPASTWCASASPP